MVVEYAQYFPDNVSQEDKNVLASIFDVFNATKVLDNGVDYVAIRDILFQYTKSSKFKRLLQYREFSIRTLEWLVSVRNIVYNNFYDTQSKFAYTSLHDYLTYIFGSNFYLVVKKNTFKYHIAIRLQKPSILMVNTGNGFVPLTVLREDGEYDELIVSDINNFKLALAEFIAQYFFNEFTEVIISTDSKNFNQILNAYNKKIPYWN